MRPDDAGFASCPWPIWQTDDFSRCFQQDYLKVLLPLAVVGLSIFHLAAQNIVRAVRRTSGPGYERIGNGPTTLSPPTHTELPRDEGPVSESEDEEDLTIGGGRLALYKTTTRGSIVQADVPPAQTLSVLVEELAVAGLVAVNAIALATGAYGRQRGGIAAIAGLTVWVYALILTSLRLFLGNTPWRVPRIWNHTAAIYGFQWLFTLVIFRSVLIHPSSQLTQTLVIIEFALTSLLFGMAISTRKGNKTILLEWEDGIEPGRENLASLFSHYTFSWVDSIVWSGWKEPLTIKRVWNLLPKDKAAAVLANYRQFRKTSSLAFHLVRYFKGLLLAQALWAVGGAVLTFAPTLLLRAILQYVEDPAMAPRNVLWLYVILLPVTDILRSVCDGQALWIGRKICINIRAILVGEIYAKALRRKAAAGNDTTLGAAADKKKQDAEAAKGGIIARAKRLVGLGKRSKDKQAGRDRATDGAVKKDTTGGSDEQVNLGTIINLMSVDSFKVSEVTSYLHFLIAAAPTQLLVSIVLLYQVMGLSAIPGFVVMALLLPINIAFGKGFNSSQKRIMAATDKRIHTTNEILQNIRIIKYFAWEHRFATIVDEKRRAELKALRRRFMIWAAAVAVWNTVPILITFFSFLIYTVVEKKPLYPSVAFTAISLFMLLRYPLDQLGDMIAHVQESQVSIDRIEEFLSEEETEKFAQLGIDNVDDNGSRVIGFRNATFVWGSKSTVAADGSMAFRLLDLDVDFKIGKLNVITGPTGSGKTSMLMALLGEMTIMKGRVYLPGGRSREDVRPDPETGLAETCAYVAQQAWLVNASIKDNILFSAPFDEQRYRDVIVACALERDLEILDNGDETLVGEKGITLSGGQKQRISLARAVYSNSKHLLMDDCLSAVDSHTAQWIFSNCIMGPLMRHRTCILVSHNIPLCVPPADHVVTMANGRVTGQGTPQELIAAGNLPEEAAIQKSAPGSAHISRVPSRVPSSVGEESGDTLVNEADGGQQKTRDEAAKKKDTKQQNAMEEHKAVGAVQWPVMKLYLRSMGSWWFWVVACLVFGAQQLSGVASSLWVKEWSNQYAAEETAKIHFNMNSHSYSVQTLSPTYFASIANYVKGNTTTLSTAEAHEVNATYYLTVLAIIGIAGAVAALVRDLWIFFGSLTASWKLHNRLMAAVAGARFKFFDVTPMGQIMNRFSKDLEAVDQEVAPIAIGVMSCALGIVVTVVLIAYITPGFLIAGIFITLAYVFLGQFYLHASRDLKRLESVERSPLFQQFGETLTGVTTIRAYGDERRFVRDNLARINTQLRPFIYLWAANRWLSFRTDLLGDFVAFFAGVFVILSLGKIDAGSAGISLSYAIGFADNILWLVRLYAMNEQNMNSVERIKEYLEVEQEAAAIVEKNRPPENWPAKGTVEFVDYTTRYRKELEPVLRNLTFKIEAHEKVGIVGRTGAGKSSLTLAIFRALEADEGKILIDDIDISQIGLRDLREAITIVPQEPTLFTGTIRTNLDPFDLYTDEQIFDALRRVHLIQPDELTAVTNPPTALLPEATTAAGTVAATQENQDQQDQTTPPPTQLSRPPSVTNKNVFLDLSSPVSESGNNLSQGQRQLLCLARAMLKKPSVLVMDEATASIDYATDSAIQETIRELTSTIVTIAHRLQTIVDYDKVLVLDKGRIVEYGHPWELMRGKQGGGGGGGGGGVFRGMCEMSGDYGALAAAAKKAWKGKQLVDVEEDGEEEEEREGGGGDGDGGGGQSGNGTEHGTGNGLAAATDES
ncbi:P-loop containing nucleoside triphosphate hydrolase protein [Parathielavia hyrcaniae]|uniref:P-loop containing nucleoside triphosphate hydrolase protein n=1 Tax=Parathielavia hyrcaniae TaxID=113614 RepID=A0AAN6PX24_9PEZI|nr:P-loop containing nucleoside triphosphate hydrolase protein [Parathielavia hyrcaniae]